MPGSWRLWTLVTVCLGQFMILLDSTIVNVALPSIQESLGVSPAGLEWIVNAYVLALASLILVGGTLGDRYGRKRMFLIGFALFTGFSAACALSDSASALIGFRALQGVGAALLAPLALSILVDAFPPERRAWAIGVWAGASGLGFGAGPIVGGALLKAFSWSAVFWVNVPVGLLAIVVGLRVLRESRDPHARRLDLLGALLISSALFCLTFALIETSAHGWLSTFTLSILAAAVVLAAVFVWHERRHPEPMLPRALFRHRTFGVANVTACLLYGGFLPTLFFVTLYLQNVRGLSPLEAGLCWIMANAPFLTLSMLAGRIDARFPPRNVVAAGALIAAIGNLGFMTLDADSSILSTVPWFVLDGIGFGLAVPAVSAVAMGAVELRQVGIASGVFNSSRQVGGAVGLAALGSISATVVAGRWSSALLALPESSRATGQALAHQVAGGQGALVGQRLGPAAARMANDAFTAGLRAVVVTAGGLMLLGSLLTLVAGREARPADQAAAEEAVWETPPP
jgi:EmrB/QacA subfamily drug resistance transporter